MSEKDITDSSREFFSNDNFAQENGIEIVEVSTGRAKVSMKIEDKHRNSHGTTVHGGALFTLADCAFALASNSYGIPSTCINAHISYMTAAREGVLIAEAEEFTKNPRPDTYTVTITGEDENKIAIFQGMGVQENTPVRRITVNNNISPI